jgi:hypothetical protein
MAIKGKPFVHVVSVSCQRFGELSVFVQCWLNQTDSDWMLTVVHDGPSEKFLEIMNEYSKRAPGQIEFYCTASRYGDYGHSLRDLALKASPNGEFILLTNSDNYYVPKSVEFLKAAAKEVAGTDVIIFDMIHSHQNAGGRVGPAYSFFEVEYVSYGIDIGAALVRAELAISSGFRDKTHDGDQSYFLDIASMKEDLKIAKINSTLLVHN